jgi:hypothetical protein
MLRIFIPYEVGSKQKGIGKIGTLLENNAIRFKLGCFAIVFTPNIDFMRQAITATNNSFFSFRTAAHDRRFATTHSFRDNANSL